MTWIGSTYQITHLAGGQLRVASTPGYILGLPLILIGLIPTFFFLYRIYRSKSLFPAWGILIVCLPLFFAAAMVLRTGSLILDKSANTAVLHYPEFLWHRDQHIDLQSIQYAEIRSMRASTYIALVLKSGEALTFADSTQESGQGQAVVAINGYLGVSGRPVS